MSTQDNHPFRRGHSEKTWRAEAFASLIPESGFYRTHAEWLEKKLNYSPRIAKLVSDYESVYTKGRILELIEIEAGDTVVDLGCGVGYLSFDLIKHIPDPKTDIVCMDILPEHVRFVRQRQVEEKIASMLPMIANAEQIPLKSGSVKAVMGAEIMEHVAHPLDCAREIYRILTPGGQVILSTPNHGPYERFHRIRLFIRKIAGMGPGPSEDFFDSPLTPESLSGIFEEAGFTIRRLEFSIKVPMAKRLFMMLPEKIALFLIHFLERKLNGRIFGVSMLIEAEKP